MTMLKPKTTLPSKLSDLAELTLRNMQSAIKSPRYYINMDVFHVPNKTCAVCAAGSVMAFTLDVPHNVNRVASDFPRHITHKLFAIDCLRTGAVSAALVELGRPYMKEMKLNRNITPYDECNRKPFFRDMRRLIKDLRADGC